MSKPWIRLYTDLPEHSKIQRLQDHHFKFLINCWCLTGDNDDSLPPAQDLAWRLRIDPAICQAYLDYLESIGLMDKAGDSYIPHNWEDRQFISDDSKERVRKYRERNVKRSKAVTRAVTVTAQDTEHIQSRADPEADGALSRGMDFSSEMQTHLRTAGLDNTPDDLLVKLSQRAQKYKRSPTHAASVFLEVYHKAQRRNGIKDGVGYLLAAFDKAIAPVH